jgi:hypothetical protein
MIFTSMPYLHILSKPFAVIGILTFLGGCSRERDMPDDFQFRADAYVYVISEIAIKFRPRAEVYLVEGESAMIETLTKRTGVVCLPFNDRDPKLMDTVRDKSGRLGVMVSLYDISNDVAGTVRTLKASIYSGITGLEVYELVMRREGDRWTVESAKLSAAA